MGSSASVPVASASAGLAKAPSQELLGIQRDYSGTWLSVEEQLKTKSASTQSAFAPFGCRDGEPEVGAIGGATGNVGQDASTPLLAASDDFLRIESLVNGTVCE